MTEKWAEPKWWWIVVIIVALAAIGVPTGYNEWVRQTEAENRKREEQRLRDLAVPRLAYVQHNGPDASGITRITYQNQSPSNPATIQHITFTVNDPEQLRMIALCHPRAPMQAAAPIDQGEAKLLYGGWSGDAYVFFVNPSIFVRANEPIELKTCIMDPKLPRGQKLTGAFAIAVFNGRVNLQQDIVLSVHRR